MWHMKTNFIQQVMDLINSKCSCELLPFWYEGKYYCIIVIIAGSACRNCILMLSNSRISFSVPHDHTHLKLMFGLDWRRRPRCHLAVQVSWLWVSAQMAHEESPRPDWSAAVRTGQCGRLAGRRGVTGRRHQKCPASLQPPKERKSLREDFKSIKYRWTEQKARNKTKENKFTH